MPTVLPQTALDIKPYKLYMENEYEIYLDPVAALSRWIEVLKAEKIPKKGFVFRSMASNDRIDPSPDAALVRIYANPLS
jgi:hypothetical protein